ncbi:MAG: hypothetical protein V7K68_07185 [Nostoc sp.]|uniref:hypothetical protein n=1 Tax=Nostoc sp. TaxID=1180 RepID=UPI002FF65C35
MEIYSYAPLATAFAGLVVGFFAEPVKTWINSGYKRKQLRHSLYKEIANMYFHLKQIEKFRGAINTQIISHPENQYNIEERKKINTYETLLNNLKLISTRCYDYTNREILLFYELPEAIDIDIIYTSFFALSHKENLENINLDSLFDFVSNLIKIIEYFPKIKEVDKSLFKNYIDQRLK